MALSALDIHRKKNIFAKYILKTYIRSKKLDLHLKKLIWEGWCCDVADVLNLPSYTVAGKLQKFVLNTVVAHHWV